MGGVSVPGGDGGLNVELNLVPFIDLLSSLVLFLLLSAVWIQIASIQASVDTKGASSSAAPPPSKRLTVHITARGYNLEWPSAAGKQPHALGKRDDHYDLEALAAVVAAATKKSTVTSGAVGADEVVPYGAVIEAIDTIKAGGVPNVALAAN
jgi:biopolymer transport protein ExbD